MSVVVSSLESNPFLLDVGTMFANVPRVLWEKWVPADALGRGRLASRCFLVEDLPRQRRILIEGGMGVFFEPRLAERYGVQDAAHQLLASLAGLGHGPDAIDGVVLSHLHFDHVGGLLSVFQKEHPLALIFPRAQFFVSRAQWRHAEHPHRRDRASFLPEAQRLLADSGRLVVIDEGCCPLGPPFSLTASEGHTPGMLITEVATERGSVCFPSDLIPGSAWVHAPITTGYDRFAERLVDEKLALLARCLQTSSRLLLTHDPQWASCRVAQDEKGRYLAVDCLPPPVRLEL